MEVQTRLETYFLSISLPRASLSLVLVLPRRIWERPDSDSAPAFEAKRGGARGLLGTLPASSAG